MRHDIVHTGKLCTTKMFISIHLKQLTRHLRGSQRNAIHKKILSSQNCPLNPSLGATLYKASKTSFQQWITRGRKRR